MSEFDWQFRELFTKSINNPGFSLSKALWDMALENQMLPSDLLSIYTEWRQAQIQEWNH